MELTARDMIREILLERKENNPSYSLRSFARDLEISPGYLSNVLSGKRNISFDKADQFSVLLKLNPFRKKIFRLILQIEHEKNESKLPKLKEKLNRLLNETKRFTFIEMDSFKLLNDWKHLCVLELFDIDEDNEKTFIWFKERVTFDEIELEDILARLIRQGLVSRQEGIYKKIHEDLTVNTKRSNESSRSIKKFHESVLEKAKNDYLEVHPDKKDYSALIIDLAEDEIPVLKKMITEFRSQFNNQSQKGKKDRVYCFSMQFFPLDKKVEKDPNK